MTAVKLRCMTCQKDYEPTSPLIHTRLAQFDDWCICQECIDVAMKQKAPAKDKD
jgi:hypothetical protein